jgi:hypothetical protein
MKSLGIGLVILGLIVLVFGGMGYDRERTILHMGSMKAMVTEHRTIPIAPIAGVVLFAGGVVLLVMSGKRHA